MDFTDNRITKHIKKYLTSAKYKHTLGTLKTALELAKKHTISQEKIITASLLHDIGRKFSQKQMISYVKKNKLNIPELDKIIKNNPFLLHGFISADIARKEFGVRDKSILKAISFHTIAGPKMSELAKIIYLADITAPDRRYNGVKKLRIQAKKNINQAMLMAMEYKIYHVLSRKKWLHPQVLKAWNEHINGND